MNRFDAHVLEDALLLKEQLDDLIQYLSQAEHIKQKEIKNDRTSMENSVLARRCSTQSY